MPTVERNRFIPDPRDKRGKNDYQGNHDVYEMPEDHKPGLRLVPQMSSKLMLAWIIGVVFIAGVALAVVELYRESGGVLS
ncbi:MAG: hypothetical protein M3N59_00965 [bacterium]|nr:hypothetical protein [bacterium]